MTEDEAKAEAAHMEREARLAARITPEMIAVLVEAMRTSGHNFDAIEVYRFVQWLAGLAGTPIPHERDLWGSAPE